VLDWGEDVRPVLEAAYEAWCVEARETAAMGRSEPWVTTENVNTKLGRQPDDSHTEMVLKHLERGGYLTADRDIRDVSLEITFTEKGLQYVAGWPGTPEDAMLSRFVAAVREQIETATTPEERSAWQKLLSGLTEVPRGVMVGVLTKLITGGLDAAA
jgi:hypothetical protein